MWRLRTVRTAFVAGFSASVLLVAGGVSADAALGSLRPVPRPEAKAPMRPVPRPVQTANSIVTPQIIRPVLRPASATAVQPPQAASLVPDKPPEMVAMRRPPPRPRALVVPAALPAATAASLAQPARIAPQPVVKPVVKTPTATARAADVVMVGDSITAGGRWSANYKGVRVVNRGVSSDTALKILARMDGILETRPKRALLMFGINDIYNGVPVNRILHRYDEIVAILLSRDIEVVIQATLACSGSGCGDKLAKVKALNAGLRGLAKARGLQFVDINRALADRNGLKPAFTRDGVHLNGQGYAQWYAVLKPYITRS